TRAGTVRPARGIAYDHPIEHHRRRRRQGVTALGRRERAIHLAPGPVLRGARAGIAGTQGDREAESPRLLNRRLDETSLPDPRLTAEEQNVTAAAPGVREAVAQGADLDLAPDEGDVVHARRHARRSRSGERAMGRIFIARLRRAGTVTAPARASSLCPALLEPFTS